MDIAVSCVAKISYDNIIFPCNIPCAHYGIGYFTPRDNNILIYLVGFQFCHGRRYGAPCLPQCLGLLPIPCYPHICCAVFHTYTSDEERLLLYQILISVNLNQERCLYAARKVRRQIACNAANTFFVHKFQC